MPWKQVGLMSQRREFLEKILLPGANVSSLCKEYSISRKTAYKWMGRYEEGGLSGLIDQSKAPKCQSNKTEDIVEKLIVETHQAYPYWGPRKLRSLLINEGLTALPAVSTIARILERQGCEVIKNFKSAPAKIRFEKSQANELWQMDFKGHFMTQLDRCYPLTIIDDHSRYSIGLRACKNEQGITVKEHLITCFKEFGLPEQINVDNGSPWGNTQSESHTALAIWLIKCGVRLSHSAPYHPQTNGKDERFHRTLKLEVLHNKVYKSCDAIQKTFDEWRHVYNYKRPHVALEGKPPCHRYHPSARLFSGEIGATEYESGDIVRSVHKANGTFRFKGKIYRAGKGLCGEYIAIKETEHENEYSVFFRNLFIRKFNLAERL